ncbi:Uma2 family endonuclease [Streptomyces tubercidicus]|uniref:Uma2 family endonuclease n=1 Tax=Streptomyces tubercidicus TaxID=47759 RepID=UPI002E10CE6E|nr:Uma2 family endonuclease [Streptomyces tubercidicus]WSX23037.1 Uma2 family endonuclease [Streptomyces tubercidicus]
MTALAHEAPEMTSGSDLDELLWQAWKAMELPEGLRAEIVEGFIEVSPTGRFSHGKVSNQLRQALILYLAGEARPYAVNNDMNVIHGRKVWIPDAFVSPEDDDEFVTEDGLGLDARCVGLIVEVVSPGHDGTQRDRVRKRRAYSRAGIPVYVLIDAYDDHGVVTLLTDPRPDEATYGCENRVSYGTDVTIPEGPAKGFVIGEAITGPPRNA